MMEPSFYESKFKDGKILAFADVDLDGGIIVKGFRIVDSDKGLFAAVPSRPVKVGGETRYMNIVAFASTEQKERFLTELLRAYHRWERERRGEASGPENEPGEATSASG